MVWDHCHKTNQFRGWLCHGCNLALGIVRDNPDILRNMIAYLKRFASEQAKREGSKKSPESGVWGTLFEEVSNAR
jgi:hypothetical protein